MDFKKYIDGGLKEMRVGLVRKIEKRSKEIIKELKDEAKLNKDIIKEIELLNKELKRKHRSKFKFDFCLSEDINIDELPIKNKKFREKLKFKYFLLNDEISRFKTEIERKLKESLDG